MDYQDLIDPELQKTARVMPFNRRIVAVGNVYQAAAWKLAKIPAGITVKAIETAGYQRLKLKRSGRSHAGPDLRARRGFLL